MQGICPSAAAAAAAVAAAVVLAVVLAVVVEQSLRCYCSYCGCSASYRARVLRVRVLVPDARPFDALARGGTPAARRSEQTSE